MDDRTEVSHADPRAEIAWHEARIEELAAKIERCRKIIVASRAAVAVGILLLLALMLGAIRSDPLIMSVGVVAALGGIVLSGTNRSTAEEARAQMEAAEARRAELIDLIAPHVVGGPNGAGAPS